MSFQDTLRNINLGRFAEELDQEFADLINSCKATGKKGEIIVKLTMKPGKGGARVMTVDHDYKVKSPQFDRPTDHFFVTDQGALVVDNPDQKKLDLRPIGGRKPTSETVDPETGEILDAHSA
jgi:hypothetical protein